MRDEVRVWLTGEKGRPIFMAAVRVHDSLVVDASLILALSLSPDQLKIIAVGFSA